MSNTKISVTFDSEKLNAIRQFSDDAANNIETVLQGQLEKIYIKTVPIAVRKYIDGRNKSAPKSKKSEKPPNNLPNNPPNNQSNSQNG